MTIPNCLSISSTAIILGVSTKTLRRWDACGKLKADYRTKGNHRRYERKTVLSILRNQHQEEHLLKETRAGIYARVSSSKQIKTNDLERYKARHQ